MMHMTFYWGRKMVLLFDSWKTDSWTSYSLSLLAVFLFSLFYQYMEDRRLRLKLLSSSSKPSPLAASDAIGAPLLPRRPYGGKGSARVAVALLFGINSAIGYLLMLAVMSYNGGVFVAVVLGLAAGYLVFRSAEEGLVFVENPCACA